MKYKTPIAILMFGRICSGKTTFAKNLERNNNFYVISKDRCILESELKKRSGENHSWEHIRELSVEDAINMRANVVVDETARIGRISSFKKAGYEIIGVNLDISIELCRQRLENRLKRRNEILISLSNIINIDVINMPQNKRRDLWCNSEIVNSIPYTLQKEFNDLINEIYTLGCDYIKEEYPNPACFPELDYVVELNENVNLYNVSLNEVIEQKIPYNVYLRSQLSKIKYCIWDIGGVVYDFSLIPLDKWCKEHTMNVEKQNFKYSIKKYDFDDYMKGFVTFEKLCKDICNYYDIQYDPQYLIDIEQALWLGVSNDFDITHRLLVHMKEQGIKNCILSNALPILLESGKYQEFIDTKNRFYSFDLHMLKPSPDIYIKVKDILECDFHNIVFVDDKEENVNAAKELGIYSILFSNNIMLDPFFQFTYGK